MPNLQKPTDSSKRPTQKQSTKKKATLLTQDDNLAFDATVSPPPRSTTDRILFSHGTDDRDFDEGEQQDKDKQQKPINIQPLYKFLKHSRQQTMNM
jgi:hypothetical protein